jgi:sugar lactone lactonase YvrE
MRRNIQVDKIILLLFVLFATSKCYSQTVQKITTHLLNGPDGITTDNKDNIYVANWGQNGDGRTIIRIDNLGNETIYIDSLNAPDGLTFDKQGNLFVSCFASNEVLKISPQKKKQSLIKGIYHPSDLKFDNAGNLYISCFGDYNGTRIYKADSIGNHSIFSDSIQVPLGLLFMDNHLFVSSFASGEILKISPAGKKSLYAKLPNDKPGYFQYLAVDAKKNLYCPSFGHNCIYKITPEGKVLELELQDRSGNSFKPAGPNSILINDGYLYFTEFTNNSIYKVKLPDN